MAEAPHDPHLTRATTYNIADTNIALLGSDLEKRVHEHAGDKEQAWSQAGLKPGLQIWRVEKFAIKTWPPEKKGVFYDGDSYIVLYTYKKTPDSERLLYDLHFWLGESTSQDEAAVAAYKTVELDDHLHGNAVQYREMQHHESPRFLSYFKDRFISQKGGVATGFHHVSTLPPKDTFKLYQIGSSDSPQVPGHPIHRNLFVREMPVEASSLVQGDVYILDRGTEGVWQLNTKSSTDHEKFRAAEFSRDLLNGRHGGDVTVFDEDGHNERKFLEAVKAASIPPKPSKPQSESPSLYKISDASGKMVFEEVSPPTRPSLVSSDAFLLDTTTTEALPPAIYVWLGKDSSLSEQRIAVQYGQKYLYEKQATHGDAVNVKTSLVKLREGHEPDAFEAAFPYSPR